MALDLAPNTLNTVLEQANIATELDEDLLSTMGANLVALIDADLDSRSEWEDCYKEWIKLASQIFEPKNYPWPKAANIKYPLVTTASLQFHARAQAALIGTPDLVKAKVFGADANSVKAERADRVSSYMSYQLTNKMGTWMDDTDRLLLLLPIVGVAYKKIYWDTEQDAPVSELVLPIDLIINYGAQDFKQCRKTHRIPVSQNTMVGRMRTGFYRNVDLPPPGVAESMGAYDDTTKTTNTAEMEDQPYIVYEVHGWYDMDDDGYKEPWIITIEKDSKKVLRVTPRFEYQDVVYNGEGEVAKIEPQEYFTQYGFIPNPESSVYWQGLGAIVGPLNHGVNTLINQLIDAGTLAVLPSGFLARGIRLQRGGRMRFTPGEWKILNVKASDLKTGVMPLPVKEPSTVLFSLLGLLVESGQQVASIADVMTGTNPGQNQPYSTTVAVIEQGLQIFVSIYRRIYRSLTREYKLLYRANSMYLSNDEYIDFHDEPQSISAEDFEGQSLDIAPTADPDMVSDAQKALKAEALAPMIPAGLVNPRAAVQRMLEAQRQPRVKELMDVPPPSPNLEQQLEQQKFQEEMKLKWAQLQVTAQVEKYAPMKDMAQALVNLAKSEHIKDETARAGVQQTLDALIAEMQMADKQLEGVLKLAGAEVDTAGKALDIMNKQREIANGGNGVSGPGGINPQ